MIAVLTWTLLGGVEGKWELKSEDFPASDMLLENGREDYSDICLYKKD